MANISSYLAAIMAAVYGEDVRSSIHDAIDIINKVGEVVLNTGTDVTEPTSSSTGFYDGSFYINTNTMELWKCIGTDAWQSQGVLKGADGADGNGIVSIVKTGTVGLVDTYTITFDDGSTETYQITNGQNGSKWYKGTAISGTGTSITGFPGTKDDFYLNSVDGYVYVCTKTGGAMVPDAAEWDYVMTLTGGGGSAVTVIDNLISTSSTDALSANQGRALNEKKQEKFSSYSAGLKEEMIGPAGSQTLQLSIELLAGSNISLEEKDGKIEINSIGGQGGGMLPYLYIDSEAGATVTVNQPDGTTITPTAAGSGHWECELTGGYGTYVIHSALSGQGDATQSLAVDTVKEYHVTDTHYDYTINVTAPSGSSIRITGGGETYTGTGTGSSQAFAVHTASTTYTVAVTMDGNTKSETITSAATSGQSGSVNIAFGTINLTYANDFRGKTITCTKSGVTVTKTAPSSGNTMTFRVPTTGTWTISGTIGSDTYSTTATVTSLGTAVSASLATIPEGSTVLPTDVIQTWLNCAGIYDKTSYTTLADVLADSTTLLALMSDNNAVDYLVRSTTWATDICADSTAMTDIGANNYAADTLLDNSTWRTAICNSTYFESVLNVKVPVMTSNTTPSGVASAESEYTVNPAWKAFDGNNTTASNMESSALTKWIQYQFENAVKIFRCDYYVQYTSAPTSQINAIKHSDDGTTFIDDVTNISIENGVKKTTIFNSSSAHTIWRVEVTTNPAKSTHANEIQFYGREDV